MNTVLYPLAATDFSASANHAAERAAMLARQTGGQLALVHVLEKNALEDLQKLFAPSGENVAQSVRQQAQDALTQLVDALAVPESTPVRCHLVDGAVLEAIPQQADVLGCNLVVMGAHGVGFMRHWLLGATAERLLRKTTHPVLVVNEKPRQPYHTVLVPVDFSDWSLRGIELAQRLATHAKIFLLHACELPFEGKLRFAGVAQDTLLQHRETIRRDAMHRLRELATAAGLASTQWQALVTFGNPPDYILEQSEEQGADLIVLGKHGSGMTEELLLGSVTKHVLAHARADTLVVVR